MKHIVDSVTNAVTQEPLIPANVAVLSITTFMDLELILKIALTVSMTVLTCIKIYKELKSKSPENGD